jgi:hypothetical protein
MVSVASPGPGIFLRGKNLSLLNPLTASSAMRPARCRSRAPGALWVMSALLAVHARLPTPFRSAWAQSLVPPSISAEQQLP